MKDRDYMLRAIELARRGEGRVNPNPLVGAVIVKEGRIIGEGWHHVYGGLHAERDALRSAKEPVRGAVVYVTLEPCCHYGKQPPCTLAIIESGIRKVVIGSRDPNPKVAGKGVLMLKEHGIIVEEDFMREECDALNAIFSHYITTGTPFVKMKYAMTADGKIATRTGASKWISCEASRERAHKWRNACMAIMVGIGTVLADDPTLNCRIPDGRNPVRIICDSNLRIPEDCQIVRTADRYETIVACACPELPEERASAPSEALRSGADDREAKAERLRSAGITVINVPEASGEGCCRVSLRELMRVLGARGIDSVLLEGGGRLNESALREGIVQEVNVFVAPKIFGGKARTPVEGIGVEFPSEALPMRMKTAETVGEDLLITYEIRPQRGDGPKPVPADRNEMLKGL